MKKTSRSILLITIMAFLLFTLTGCGGNKLVATTSSEYGDEKMEITFNKDDTPKKIVWTIKAEDTADAKEITEEFKEDIKGIDGAKVKRNGKKVVLTMKYEAFIEYLDIDIDTDISRDEFEEMLEILGFEIE
ncbi:MAG: hypothetical protein E7313_06800 [Clostridiales bacterium]|nr:hypothetical protein [Clostridiales bacterium]